MLQTPQEPRNKTAPGDLINQVINLYQKGDIPATLSQAQELIQTYPDNSTLHNVLGACLSHTGQTKQALIHFKEALKLNPSNPAAYNNLGNILTDLQQYEEAQKHFEYAINIKPDFAEAHNNLGTAFKEQNEYEKAIPHYEKAININPNYFEAYNNLGVVFNKLKNYSKAEEALKKAIQLHPEFAEAYSNLGSVFTNQKQYSQAIKYFDQATKINPNNAEALKNKGLCLETKGEFNEALIAYDKAISCQPNFFSAIYARIYLRQQICEWNELGQLEKEFPKLGITGASVKPFPFLSFEDHPERQLRRASKYVSETFKIEPIPLDRAPKPRSDKIRVGYFSADFHDHPVSHQIAQVLALHDRSKIEVYAYSFAQADDDMRKRIIGAVDHFKDVTDISDKDVALLAREDKIDIAIDLMGYTGGSRTNIFAYRAAPIQIYLFGGTTGADFIDYVIADHTVIPDRLRQYYQEKIIFLPYSFMPTDNTKKISDAIMTRQDMGLPEDGFVFCCFNASYKISPREFDIWMRLLTKVEGSVLWLRQTNQWAKKNLQKEAEQRGVDPSRLIFTERLPTDEHLARHKLADLFLDTFNFTAHSTASDALWAGLPIITKKGEQFVSRCAASMLNAVGLPAVSIAVTLT